MRSSSFFMRMAVASACLFAANANANPVLSESSVKREGYIKLYSDGKVIGGSALYFLVETKDGRYGLEREGFASLPFALPPGQLPRCSSYIFTEVCWLDQIPKGKFNFDNVNQSLNVDVPALWRRQRQIDFFNNPNFAEPNNLDLGFALNYSASLLHGANGIGGGVLLDTYLYADESIFYNSFSASSTDWLDGKRPSQRLRSFWTTHSPSNNAIFTVGDATTGATTLEPYRRRVHFGGLQVQSDSYSRIQSRQPTFAIEGIAVEPSTIELFVDSQRVYTSSVIPPGPFQVTSLPSLTDGNVAVVVKDALGREKVITRPFFRNQNLLGAGKDLYSFSAGVLRENLGSASFDYSGVMMTGQYAYGFTNQTTGSFAFEVTEDLLSVGGEVSLGIAEIRSLLNVRVAASTERDAGNGGIYSVGLRTRIDPFSLTGSLNYYDKGFRQIGLDDARSEKKDYRIGVNTYLGETGSLDFTYARLFSRNGSDNKNSFLRARISERTRNDISYGVSASVNPDDPENYQLSFNLGWKWGAEGFNISHAVHPEPQSTNYSVSRGVANDQIGYTLNYFTDYRDQEQFSGSISGVTEAANFTAFMADGNGAESFAFTANGAVAIFDSNVIVSRSVGSRLMIVKADGVKGGKVAGGPSVSTTDSDGYAAVQNLSPYVEYNINIVSESQDVFGLETKKVVSPFFGANFVELESSSGGQATMTLKLPDGKFVPIGSQINHADAKPSERAVMVVGADGYAYVVGMKGTTTIHVTWNSFGACKAVIKLPEDKSDPLPDLGVVTCLPSK